MVTRLETVSQSPNCPSCVASSRGECDLVLHPLESRKEGRNGTRVGVHVTCQGSISASPIGALE